MSLKQNVEVVPLGCFYPGKGMEVCPVQTRHNPLESPGIYSQETTLITLPSGIVNNLYVHQHQTDQLFCVRGSAVIVVWQNHEYEYILLTENNPVLVKIPPSIPHGSVNLTTKSCTLLNSIVRYAPSSSGDYRSVKLPQNYDLEAIRQLFLNVRESVVSTQSYQKA
ncbi:MAG: hypothetical protein SAJ12_03230 [Jaaginema sp. PMC 1079.18]|nr:hypothetical protein [Jaaginema sp. PMC 1080.18]MEC4850000.1 hypothetical protein [Jaaginema sp. PMC 1079.18]MEC4866484.1 hypothetical protein [Jaaginema sp. PMC 1078.18]